MSFAHHLRWHKIATFFFLISAWSIQIAWDLPLCLGCMSVQFLFCFSLFFSDLMLIRTTFFLSLGLELYMMYSQTISQSCGLDSQGRIATHSCGADLFLGPFSILQWSVLVTMLLFLNSLFMKRPSHPEKAFSRNS